MDAFSSGLVAPLIVTENETECCRQCKANTKCEAFVMGAGGCNKVLHPECNNSQMHCFLVGGFHGLHPSVGRKAGCVRTRRSIDKEDQEAPEEEPYFSQNNTIAAFLIARGTSAVLELPVSSSGLAAGNLDIQGNDTTEQAIIP